MQQRRPWHGARATRHVVHGSFLAASGRTEPPTADSNAQLIKAMALSCPRTPRHSMCAAAAMATTRNQCMYGTGAQSAGVCQRSRALDRQAGCQAATRPDSDTTWRQRRARSLQPSSNECVHDQHTVCPPLPTCYNAVLQQQPEPPAKLTHTRTLHHSLQSHPRHACAMFTPGRCSRAPRPATQTRAGWCSAACPRQSRPAGCLACGRPPQWSGS